MAIAVLYGCVRGRPARLRALLAAASSTAEAEEALPTQLGASRLHDGAEGDSARGAPSDVEGSPSDDEATAAAQWQRPGGLNWLSCALLLLERSAGDVSWTLLLLQALLEEGFFSRLLDAARQISTPKLSAQLALIQAVEAILSGECCTATVRSLTGPALVRHLTAECAHAAAPHFWRRLVGETEPPPRCRELLALLGAAASLVIAEAEPFGAACGSAAFATANAGTVAAGPFSEGAPSGSGKACGPGVACSSAEALPSEEVSTSRLAEMDVLAAALHSLEALQRWHPPKGLGASPISAGAPLNQPAVGGERTEASTKRTEASTRAQLADSELDTLGAEAELVRLVALLAYRRPTVQHRVRELGGVPLVLGCCQLDERNPIVREWALLAVRNLCEGCPENQSYIAAIETRPQGVAPGCEELLAAARSAGIDIGLKEATM